jgi:hypothetical protein
LPSAPQPERINPMEFCSNIGIGRQVERITV